MYKSNKDNDIHSLNVQKVSQLLNMDDEIVDSVLTMYSSVLIQDISDSLNNGVYIPLLGIGLMKISMDEDDELVAEFHTTVETTNKLLTGEGLLMSELEELMNKKEVNTLGDAIDSLRDM